MSAFDRRWPHADKLHYCFWEHHQSPSEVWSQTWSMSPRDDHQSPGEAFMRGHYGALVVSHSPFVHTCSCPRWKGWRRCRQGLIWVVHRPPPPPPPPFRCLWAPVSSWLTKILIRPRATALRPQKHIHTAAHVGAHTHTHCSEHGTCII